MQSSSGGLLPSVTVSGSSGSYVRISALTARPAMVTKIVPDAVLTVFEAGQDGTVDLNGSMTAQMPGGTVQEQSAQVLA